MDAACRWLVKCNRGRAELILISPEGDVVGYILYFKFLTTNNEVEYEALIVDLKIVREAGALYLRVFNES